MTGRARLLRLTGLLAVLAVLTAVAVYVGVPDLESLRSQSAALGWWAPAVFVLLYAVVSLLPLPKTVFTLAGGALFGLPAGLSVVVIGAMLGAVAAFLLGRFLGHDTLHWLTGGRIDALEARMTDHGVWAVVVLRLIPVVPFTAVNYLAGVTRIRLRDFLVGTLVGILPATTASVTVGAYSRQPGAWPLWAALATLLVVSAGGVVAGRRRRLTATSTGGVVPPAPR
ncbi:TVP38/TMEM64 family protein [Actinoplanes sp. NPDC023801]|uniref:TVP38/TMEM64 family protein n=1 Tax=Actinoplanes sp. NPDC023801 TaxID=3154595 RepID=UPI0033C7732D